MIKRIKGSLFAKVFILTVAVLLCVSFLVYGVLAWYMPQTYSNNLNAALDEQTSDFIYELEHIRIITPVTDLHSRPTGMTYILKMSLWLMPSPVCPFRSRVF